MALPPVIYPPRFRQYVIVVGDKLITGCTRLVLINCPAIEPPVGPAHPPQERCYSHGCISNDSNSGDSGDSGDENDCHGVSSIISDYCGRVTVVTTVTTIFLRLDSKDSVYFIGKPVDSNDC